MSYILSGKWNIDQLLHSLVCLQGSSNFISILMLPVLPPFPQRTSFPPPNTKNGSLKFLLTTHPIPQNLPKGIPSIALSQAKFSTLNLNSILFCLLGCLLNHPFSPVSSTSPSTYLPSISSLSHVCPTKLCCLPPLFLAFLLQWNFFKVQFTLNISCFPISLPALRFKHSSFFTQDTSDWLPTKSLYIFGILNLVSIVGLQRTTNLKFYVYQHFFGNSFYKT